MARKLIHKTAEERRVAGVMANRRYRARLKKEREEMIRKIRRMEKLLEKI